MAITLAISLLLCLQLKQFNHNWLNGTLTVGGVGNLADIDRPTKSMYVFPLLINFRMCVWQKRKNIAMASGVKNRGMCVDSSTAADKHTSRWVFVRRLQCKAYKNTHKICTTTNRSSFVTELLSPIYVLQCIEETLPWSRSSPAKPSCSFTVLRVLSSFHVAWHWTESSPLYAHLQLACRITTMLVWLAMDDICIEMV